MRILGLTALIIFVVDQATKWLVVQKMGLIQVGSIDVLPPVLNLRMAWNEGINFGLFSSNAEAARWVLIGVALLISIGVLIWAWREGFSRRGMIFAGLIVGGALGNVVDRVVYGAVADFLNMSCCGIRNPYSFNVADIAVFAGAFGLILFSGAPKSSKTP